MLHTSMEVYMFRGRFIVGILGMFLLFGVLSSVAGGMQRDAWTQGYLVGRLSAGSAPEGGTAVPPLPNLYTGYQGYTGFTGGFHAGHFGVFGLIIGFGLFLLILMGLAKFFRAMAWHHRGGPWGGPWSRYENRPPAWGWHESPPQPQPEQGGGGPQGWQQGGPGFHGRGPGWGWEQPPESKPEQGQSSYRGGCGYM